MPSEAGLTNWKYTLYRATWSAFDLLFPPVCAGCKKTGSRWCLSCNQKVNILDGIVCEICGLPQERVGVCKTCLADKPHFRALRAWAIYEEPLRSAIVKLKYKRDISLGDAIAWSMLPFYKTLNWDIDMIIPTPLGKKRKRERGYNQAAMLAKPFALALQVEFNPDAVIRVRETRTQVGLDYAERKKNVAGAFQAGASVKRKNIMVMDDVSTTGSTLSAIAESLYAAGAQTVYALTVARALAHHDLRQA
jgi:ComF family protein